MAEPAAFPGDCFRCGEYGHPMQDCPWLEKAADHAAHLERIARYLELWEAWKITPQQKRQFISEENKLWYGEKCAPSKTLRGNS